LWLISMRSPVPANSTVWSADDVAAADRRKADRRRVALAGDAFAGVHGAQLQVAAKRGGDDLAHRKRRAARRIDLVAVVRLDDLDVVAW
jgi:hypothetical protein